MFESILETLINKLLGHYIQGLTSKDLNVSIWSGDVVLRDLKLKPDICHQFGLPLELVCG
jgi:vacuolar protein sorting-associated protein 13A/C